MAPWIRVNGSINRRVLDKYAGTVLMHCIENAGLTLFTLCTRFHYLLPIHVHELIEVKFDFAPNSIVEDLKILLFAVFGRFRVCHKDSNSESETGYTVFRVSKFSNKAGNVIR